MNEPKRWNPQSICATMVVATFCLVLMTVEAGVVMRATAGDVSESRILISDTIKIRIGLLSGFFVGKARERD